MLRTGDTVQIEKKDGYTVFGEFRKADDEFIQIMGQIGEKMGKRILVPKSNIAEIIIVKRRSEGD